MDDAGTPEGGEAAWEPDEEVWDDGPLFTRFDTASLLAVENANGGEWASIGQVMVTFHAVFGQWPEVTDFAESCGLLCDAGLVEYADEGLSLLPAGRKLLRRAGRHGSSERPVKVTELLGQIDEDALAEEGAVAKPTEEEVAAVRAELTADATSELETLQASNQSRVAGAGIFGTSHVLPLPDIGPQGGDGWADESADDEAFGHEEWSEPVWSEDGEAGAAEGP